MNNTNKTIKTGFSNTTNELGSSITLAPANLTYITGQRRLARQRCKCGGRRYLAACSEVLLTYPAQYTVECENCGETSRVFETDLITEVAYLENPDNKWESLTTGSTNGCQHTFEIKLVNGRYVTYCTKCGKIGDNIAVGIDLSCNNPNLQFNLNDPIPCIDPLRFTCAVEGKTTDFTQATINEDEIKKVKAHAGSTITTK